ncbi:uncharacterized protein F4822DRAFT_426313 [Hypoxylon trugodes]|uniref:uncharacterized protein n=1 Tax=Hypoxylon trugodes TaxID=326681 RepID=UPI002197222F|nr:uncharacterized protein F4822DRAFT_426313 [Hypoxylon trugodes]KAI1390465.1 hypothetical protein F4822DRAFT_426313 [Hypoxylon trugodes]
MATDDISSRTRSRANDLLVYGQRQVDRVVSPPTRQKAYNWVYDFSIEKPILSSFVAFQLALSLAPILLFAGFATTTIAVSLISALLFSLFWIGIATLFLVPTLFITFSIALFFWAWAAATFFAGRYVYGRLSSGADGDGKVVANSGEKKIIFEKKNGKNNDADFDAKAEATEVKE